MQRVEAHMLIDGHALELEGLMRVQSLIRVQMTFLWAMGKGLLGTSLYKVYFVIHGTLEWELQGGAGDNARLKGVEGYSLAHKT